jgi:hypothetical protein
MALPRPSHPPPRLLQNFGAPAILHDRRDSISKEALVEGATSCTSRLNRSESGSIPP